MAENMQDVGLRAKIDGMGAFMRDARQIDQQTKSLGQRMTSVARESVAASKGIGSILDPLGKLGFAVFGVQQLANAFSGLGRAILGPSADWEQYQTQFETLLGSAEFGQAKLEELSEFARKTPFTLPSVTEAAKQLLAYGFGAEKLIPMLRKVGDAAAGLGDDAFGRVIRALGQMQARTKVSSQEMLQLTEVGIPAWQMLADAAGRTVGKLQELVEQGVIPADWAIDNLLAGMDKRFGGLMDKQAKTLKGMLSNLEDWSFRARTILSEGLFEGAKDVLGGVLETLDTAEVEDTLRNWGRGLGEFTSNAIKLGQEVLPSIVQGARDAMAAWERMGEKGQRGLMGMAVLLVAGGPIISGFRMAATAAFGIARALDFAILKGLTLAAVAGAGGAALQAFGDAMTMGFDKWGDRFQAHMGSFGNEITGGLNKVVGGMLGEEAQESLDELYEVNRKIFDLNRDIALDTASKTKAEKEYQAALKGRDTAGRTLEFSQRYEAEARALKNVEEYQRRLSAAEVERTGLMQQQSKLQGDAVANGFEGGFEKAGDVVDWFVGRASDAYDTLRQRVADNPIVIDIVTAGNPLDMARSFAANIHDVKALTLQPSADQWATNELARFGIEADKTGRYVQNAATAIDQATNQSLPWLNSALGSTSSALKGLQEELRDTEAAFRAFSDPRLVGMQAGEDEIFALEMAIKQARLEELGLAEDAVKANQKVENTFDLLAAQQREVAEGIPVAFQRYEWELQQAQREAERTPVNMPAESEATNKVRQLEKLLEAAQLRFDIAYEPQLRALRETAEELEGKNKEITFEEALRGLADTSPLMTELRDQIDDQEDSISRQKTAVDGITTARTEQLTVEERLAKYWKDQETSTDRVLANVQSIAAIQASMGGNRPASRIGGPVEGLADGGTVGQGGVVKVGERGSELAILPSGTRVLPHSALAAASVTRTYNDTFNIYGASQPLNVWHTIQRQQRFARITQGR